mmetsp:Transcript_28242/g.59392  ORF Transcript_28242/g.59392 Transcript_28242/m.59392 type:complete len:310 (-) Transcript_28242:125-1054(-)
MKVFLRYEDNDDESTHKTLKITLPKIWKSGPTSRLLEQFVESYNSGKEAQSNTLDVSSLHLSIRRPGNTDDEISTLKDLPSDGIIIETISDRDDVYVCHGPSRTTSEISAERQAQLDKQKEEMKNLSKCIHFGCNNRFPKGGPYPECKYHSGPPVFHETAKYWSCCPDKKCFDFEDFLQLPTCQTGTCTDVRDDCDGGRKEFMGGCDIREQLSGGPKLRSIDDFNRSVAAGGSEGAPVLERLRSVMEEIGVENELFDQVLSGVKKEVREKNGFGVERDDALVVDEAVKTLGEKLKNSMKAIAVEQLRIN